MERRLDEARALEAIYGPDSFVYQVVSSNEVKGQLSLSARLPDEGVIIRAGTLPDRTLRHLPPLVVSFTLPENYPDREPPTVRLSCSWLPVDDIDAIVQEAADLFVEGSESVFVMVDRIVERASDVAAGGISLDKRAHPAHLSSSHLSVFIQ